MTKSIPLLLLLLLVPFVAFAEAPSAAPSAAISAAPPVVTSAAIVAISDAAILPVAADMAHDAGLLPVALVTPPSVDPSAASSVAVSEAPPAAPSGCGTIMAFLCSIFAAAGYGASTMIQRLRKPSP